MGPPTRTDRPTDPVVDADGGAAYQGSDRSATPCLRRHLTRPRDRATGVAAGHPATTGEGEGGALVALGPYRPTAARSPCGAECASTTGIGASAAAVAAARRGRVGTIQPCRRPPRRAPARPTRAPHSRRRRGGPAPRRSTANPPGATATAPYPPPLPRQLPRPAGSSSTGPCGLASLVGSGGIPPSVLGRLAAASPRVQ